MSKKAIVASVLVVCCCYSMAFCAPAKCVILFIGDGLGFELVKAAGMYANGEPNTLCFESFPYRGEVTTYSADSPVPDSAAATTAMATGVKVNNHVVSVAIPGDSNELETVLELAQSHGKNVGLVTTTYIAHATPACFAAHEASRFNYTAIIEDYLSQTRPNVLFGGAKYMSASAASTAGYTVVTDRVSMQSLNTNSVNYVSGQFGSGHFPYEYDGIGILPHLSEMTASALEILDNEKGGFLLMVEGGRIDHACHGNDIERSIFETLEFTNAVGEAIDWAAGRSDTMILVTSDHETGGLTVVANNGQGQFPTVTWSTTSHTAANVPIYGWGVNAVLVSGVLDNTDIFSIGTVNEVGFPDYDWDIGVDFVDFAYFARDWDSADCVFPFYCDGADLDLSGAVDVLDLEIFANNWLETAYGYWGRAELSGDGKVNWVDFTIFAEYWMSAGCGDCGGADFTGEGSVDLADLAVFAAQWLAGI